MTASGFVKPAQEAWIPEVDVLPAPLAKKNPRFNPNACALPKGVDINSSLGRAILEGNNMAFENKPQTASVFPNKDKVAGDSKPNARGSIYLSRDFIAELLAQPGDLLKADISFWTKQSAAGTAWMSGSIQKPYKLDEQPAAAPVAATAAPDSDLPF